MEKEFLISEINRLKKEKNAIIMAHYYQDGDIQDIADFVGDSLALAQWAAKTDADIIMLCGVHFMGETAKILSPNKKVLVPDMAAGCSLADSCPADEFEKFIKAHPGHKVISYVNTTAAVKALTDVVVTSTNAKQIVESFPKDEKIIFGPDKNLGNYINSITGRNMVLWNGACHVHEKFSVRKVLDLKKEYPDAQVLVHP
jgi:quinolinate synthase